MRKLKRLACLLAALVLAVVLATPALAADEADAAAVPDAADASDPEVTAMPELAVGELVYIGDIATRVEDSWECDTSYALAATTAKTYETMVGNVLRMTLYSTIPEDEGSAFYLPMDSHITYVDGTDRFTMTGRRGAYYCYQKDVRITAGGSFDLTVANTNATLYSGLYDTVSLTVYDSIETLDFFAEQSAGDASVTYFFVTANGSATALITPDTTGFNATDNEWKIVTGEKKEKVLFEGTTYGGYTFHPDTIALNIEATAEAQANPTPIAVYYLGLINGKLITVGPYTYPASATTYSSSFELERSRMDVLASENTLTFYATIEAGRQPSITVTDAAGVASLQSVEVAQSGTDGKDTLAITVAFSDTAQDLDLLVGNRWSSNQIAYNYRTLHVSFLREIKTVSLTAQQEGHYKVSYAATVNGQQDLDTTAVNWYVNGALQPEHGLTLDRTYTEGGHYTVYAELAGMQSNQVESTIIYADWQANFWYGAMLLVIALAVFWLWYKARTGGRRLDGHLRDRLNGLLREADAMQAAVVQGTTTPRRAAGMMRRRARVLQRLSDQMLARYNATNMAPYQTAKKALDGAVDRVHGASRSKADDSYYVRALLSSYHKGVAGALAAMDEIVQLALHV